MPTLGPVEGERFGTRRRSLWLSVVEPPQPRAVRIARHPADDLLADDAFHRPEFNIAQAYLTSAWQYTSVRLVHPSKGVPIADIVLGSVIVLRRSHPLNVSVGIELMPSLIVMFLMVNLVHLL